MIQINKQKVLSAAVVAIIVVLSLVWTACSSFNVLTWSQGYKYQYRYTLTDPIENPNLAFRDDTIYIQFRIDDAAIKFQMQNINAQPIEIIWSDVAVGVNGKFYAVRNASNLYADSVLCSASTILPPLGYATDLVIPSKNIRYDGKQWVETDLLPTVDRNNLPLRQRIKEAVGTPVTLLLPILVGNATKQYEFVFSVASVTQIPWDKYRVPRRPTPFPRKKDLTTMDQVITAAAVVGVVGIASFWLTQKKTAPTP